jgi:hypothetical protein
MCEAVGLAASGGVVLTITNGIPGPAQSVPHSRLLWHLVCASPTSCTAVGDSDTGVVVPITDGVAGTAQAVADTEELLDIACTTASTCVAVGLSLVSGAVSVINHGTAGVAQPVGGTTYLIGVACPTAVACVSVGIDADGAGVVVTMRNIPQSPAFTSASHARFTIGAGAHFRVTATGLPAPAIRLLKGRLPAGVRYDPTTSVLAGTPAAGTAGDYHLVFVAHSSVTPDATADFTLRVVKAASTTVVSAGPARPQFGSNVTFAAVVAPARADARQPRGIVDFYLDGRSIGVAEVALTAGKANFTAVGLGAGDHRVIAIYGGDAGFNPSSGSIAVTVGVTRSFSGTLTGGLVVASGTTASLTGAHVTGSVTVAPGGALDVENSTVVGSLGASGPLAIRLCGSTIAGSVTVTGASGSVVVGTGDAGCTPDSIGGTLSITPRSTLS